jgi:hypothetical protein
MGIPGGGPGRQAMCCGSIVTTPPGESGVRYRSWPLESAQLGFDCQPEWMDPAGPPFTAVPGAQLAYTGLTSALGRLTRALGFKLD